jgi:hypothetical protein
VIGNIPFLGLGSARGGRNTTIAFLSRTSSAGFHTTCTRQGFAWSFLVSGCDLSESFESLTGRAL